MKEGTSVGLSVGIGGTSVDVCVGTSVIVAVFVGVEVGVVVRVDEATGVIEGVRVM